jgi:hypothetical protein
VAGADVVPTRFLVRLSYPKPSQTPLEETSAHGSPEESMRVKITVAKEDLKRLVIDYIAQKISEGILDPKLVKIETKSTQNYRSEWEDADFRATFDGEL